MDEKTIIKDCKNCKHYKEHYVLYRSIILMPIGGHCINPTLNPPSKHKKYKLYDNCEYWESNESVKAEKQKNIKELLSNIEKHLGYIEAALKLDEE